MVIREEPWHRAHCRKRADIAGALRSNQYRSYSSTQQHPFVDTSLSPSASSSTADLRHNKHRHLSDSSERESEPRRALPFPRRLARGVRSWIGNSGISFEYQLPPRRKRAVEKEESAAGSLRGHTDLEDALEQGDQGESEDVDEDDGGWWSDRLGQEGLVLPLLIITFSCA